MKTDRSALRPSLREIDGYLTDFPFEDPTHRGRTMTPTQLRIAMLSLDLSQAGLAALFQKPGAAITRWLEGKEPVPLGVADWLRIRLMTRIKAMVGATGAPMMIEPQQGERPSHKALSMMGALIQNLERERRFWMNFHEGADAETLVAELRDNHQLDKAVPIKAGGEHAECVTGIETVGVKAGPLSPNADSDGLLGAGATPGDDEFTPPNRN